MIPDYYPANMFKKIIKEAEPINNAFADLLKGLKLED